MISAAWGIAAGGVLGVTVGSFLNVVIARLPAGESLSTPRSRCPHCGVPIAPRDNVPVLSWLLLRARCRACKVRISVRYPLVEATTGVLFVLATAWLGLRWELGAYLALISVLVAAAGISLEGRRVPPSLPARLSGWTVVLGAGLAFGLWAVSRAPVPVCLAVGTVVAVLVRA